MRGAHVDKLLSNLLLLTKTWIGLKIAIIVPLLLQVSVFAVHWPDANSLVMFAVKVFRLDPRFCEAVCSKTRFIKKENELNGNSTPTPPALVLSKDTWAGGRWRGRHNQTRMCGKRTGHILGGPPADIPLQFPGLFLVIFISPPS